MKYSLKLVNDAYHRIFDISSEIIISNRSGKDINIKVAEDTAEAKLYITILEAKGEEEKEQGGEF